MDRFRGQLRFLFDRLMLFIFIIVLAACSRGAKEELRLRLEDRDQEILFRVINQSGSTLKVENVDKLGLLPDEPGLRILITDQAGKAQPLCAMIDSVKTVGDIVYRDIGQGRYVEMGWSKDSLAKQYCLFPGKYLIKVNLVQSGKTYVSNEIIFENEFRP